MNLKPRCLCVLCAIAFLAVYVQSAKAQVNLRDYAKVYEVKSSNSPETDIPLSDVMDKRHNVRIVFDRETLITGLRRQLSPTIQEPSVRIRVEAKIQHGSGKPEPIEVDNFVSLEEQPAATGTDKKTIYHYHDKAVTVTAAGVLGTLPDSFINLTQVGVASGDRLYLKITDIATQADINFVVAIGEYEWNLKLTDSFLLLKRLNVSKAEEADGEKQVNFRPAPGVTFGYVYSGRKGLKKVLSPGFGYNVSFTDWSDPAFDISTGKFAKGTEASKIDITTGPIFSLFNNTLHFTYGWNLNARTDRKYWGIGFSFFNLSQKIAGLISDK